MAGTNIRRHLLGLRERGNTPTRNQVTFDLIEVEGRLIATDRIDQGLDSDLIIFLSRHTSRHPAPLLSVHMTGNLARAELGGRPFSLPPAHPVWMKAVFLNLQRYAPPGYQVTYEVTHHGPTELSIPSFFVEIGSTEREWKDPAAGNAVALAVQRADPIEAIPLLGLGGNHYATRATEIASNSPAAFGHIIHSREVGQLDESTLLLLRERSHAAAAYIDRHALTPAAVRNLEAICDRINLPAIGEGELRRLGSIGLQSYLALRHLAVAVAPRSTIVLHRLSGEGTPVTITVQNDLLEEALKANEDHLLQALDTMPLAHLVSINGRILPIFLTYDSLRAELINDLIRLCVKTIIGNQTTSINGDTLIIHHVRFDPHKARALGIAKGPLFGMLSAGHAIEKDGRMITPEMVRTEYERTLQIPGLVRYV